VYSCPPVLFLVKSVRDSAILVVAMVIWTWVLDTLGMWMIFYSWVVHVSDPN
jgi:hypothetical protein